MKQKNPHTKHELKLQKSGYKLIAGVDEVGRGCLAGPVVAAAVIFDDLANLKKLVSFGVRDSKLLNHKKMESLESVIRELALACSIGQASVSEINKIGISKATKLAMRRAVLGLEEEPDYLLIDFLKLDIGMPQEAIKFGDSICASIAAASVVAKVYRDNLMRDLALSHPNYGFEFHKGYGTALHMDMIREHGPSEIHRAGFRPVREISNS